VKTIDKMKKSGIKIPLTPGQAVTIHGWMRPKDTLSWMDVLSNEQLNMNYLHIHTKIPKELLHRMQPDIKAWVQANRANLSDAPSFIHIWAAHPIKDLKADLGDIIGFHWNAKTMRQAGVTYGDLREAGMTHETMGLFGYTLYEWSTLGFSRADADTVPAPVLTRLFCLTKMDVLRCLQ
jgi:hypothetical protein